MANPSPDEGVRAAADLHNLITHRSAWRNALVIAKEHAEVSPPDIDDKGYWQHEIDVFDRTFAALSPEPGDGAASALPSPRPSQGETVAVAGYLFDQTVGNFLFERERTRFLPYEPGDTERFGIRNVRAVVLASEHEAALAAERARADSLKAQLDEAVAQLKSHIATSEKASALIRRQQEAVDEANARLADLAKPEEQREWLPSTTIDRLQARAEAAEARAGRAEEALKPFAAIADIFDHRSQLRPTTDDSPLMQWSDHRAGEATLTLGHLRSARAALRARNILKETPHG